MKRLEMRPGLIAGVLLLGAVSMVMSSCGGGGGGGGTTAGTTNEASVEAQSAGDALGSQFGSFQGLDFSNPTSGVSFPKVQKLIKKKMGKVVPLFDAAGCLDILFDSGTGIYSYSCPDITDHSDPTTVIAITET